MSALREPGSFDVILIDGRSGSGKTSLAEELVHACGGSAQVLHIEDLYPGWDGLAEGSHAAGRALIERGYRAYNWGTGEFGPRIALGSQRPLIVEGCGAITADNLAAARSWAGGEEARVYSVWLEGSEELRQSRAFARDGDTYRPHWARWAAQEDRLFAEARPMDLADEIMPVR
ncbi:hypothetical protein G7067_06445 [Leucobacter insecticola]|uniref:ATP-binding protein n=1 Tax=Leucobacter insecticola TaxID=2714934 RepID=A0A6G8FI65_9MICO|nr:hypothetical protein [Leucobacter insecticola]QIM16140.1 hypothetical protein G7067_06445 [Leucobacter insecticola]